MLFAGAIAVTVLLLIIALLPFLPPVLVWTTQTFPVTYPVCGTWTVMSASAPGIDTRATSMQLAGIAALSESDVWAVGSYNPGNFFFRDYKTLTARWDGTSMSVVPSPDWFGLSYLRLNGVSASASGDVWAVGTDDRETLVLHWDSKSWVVVPSPNPYGPGSQLFAVEAITKNDVWAVGSLGAVHWNGETWSHITGADHVLLGVTSSAADDVWAVGDQKLNSYGIMHQDGMETSFMEIPGESGGFADLRDIYAISANDIWAVGHRRPANSGDWATTATVHWDGTDWKRVPATYPCEGNSYLNAVAGSKTDNVWAVGSCTDDEPNATDPKYRSVVTRWDGKEWSTIAGLDAAGVKAWTDVAVLPSGQVWVSGHASSRAIVGRFVGEPCPTP